MGGSLERQPGGAPAPQPLLAALRAKENLQSTSPTSVSWLTFWEALF